MSETNSNIIIKHFKTRKLKLVFGFLNEILYICLALVHEFLMELQIIKDMLIY